MDRPIGDIQVNGKCLDVMGHPALEELQQPQDAPEPNRLTPPPFGVWSSGSR
jgi:hypothetical protein